jgi:hypothetical protein
MRAQAMPGDDASTLPTPEALAAAALPLFLDTMDVTGEVFNFQRDSGKLVQR